MELYLIQIVIVIITAKEITHFFISANFIRASRLKLVKNKSKLRTQTQTRKPSGFGTGEH